MLPIRTWPHRDTAREERRRPADLSKKDTNPVGLHGKELLADIALLAGYGESEEAGEDAEDERQVGALHGSDHCGWYGRWKVDAGSRPLDMVNFHTETHFQSATPPKGKEKASLRDPDTIFQLPFQIPQPKNTRCAR